MFIWAIMPSMFTTRHYVVLYLLIPAPNEPVNNTYHHTHYRAMVNGDLENALSMHPCYNEDAHKKFARMHLPVAPRCNIQCNYCNRKYDCSNESRPGVTSEVLSPAEALEKVSAVLEKIPELKVVAIAGPGDPLANEETFETLRMVHERYPDLTLCLSTNGLALPENSERLYELGVRFVTVTLNSIDTEISSKIYSKVVWKGKRYEWEAGSEILLKNQLAGIRTCIDLGMLVKINIVLIPGINDLHIPDLVKKMENMGVYIVNILPMIPVKDTVFENMRAPTPEERKRLTDICSGKVKMMRHCRQCRADAIGMLDNDRSQEFVKNKSCGSGCGPMYVTEKKGGSGMRIAIASDGISVNRGFGNASKFVTYVYINDTFSRLDDIVIEKGESVYGRTHEEHISNLLNKLSDFDVIVVKEIGPRPMSELSSSGKKVIIASGTVDEALNSIQML